MGFKGKICVAFLLLVATFLASTSSGSTDPNQEMVICKKTCEQIIGTDQDDKPRCTKSCEKYHKEKGKWERDQPETGTTSQPEQGRSNDNNPYVFDHFAAQLETERGNAQFLQKFTEIFKGIEEYRAGVLQVEPQTFIQPNHWDAYALNYVSNGYGRVTMIEGNSRKSFNVKRGDLFLVPVGITVYLVNTDDNERLVLAKILRSVSVPGELEFFSAGRGFFNAFSPEVLEAAFEVERQSIRRMFGQQKVEQWAFRKATPEQISSLTGEDEGWLWPFGDRKDKDRHINIYKKEPSVANENGILHEVNSKDFPALGDINVAFSYYNITQGSMAGPFYNTKATLVLMVSNGVAQFEMACPHLSEQASSSGEIHPRYKKVSSKLRRGMVVVIPPGHPVVIEAFGEEGLEMVGFGLNSDENEWFPLAGRDNVMSQWEDVALELTFGFPAKEVQKVIQNQHKKLFFKAPVRRDRAFA
ncbi:vicilin Jug r 6.0101-like [Bidens hawaiensis]|uniref:vicilin Jug r 6.0101-like n=1 Tax=Bidens hawaiensis TaxID=980011 RepID=UPI00404AEA98